MDNVAKFKTTSFQLGAICMEMSEEALSWRIKGEEATYWENLQRRIPCPDCGVDLTFRSIMAHRRQMHGKETAINRDRLTLIQKEHLPLVYEFILLTNM